MREERRPGTSRYRRSSGPWPLWPAWHRAEEQAFQPKWCSSLPAVGSSLQPTTWPWLAEDGSQSITAMASLALPAGS